MKLRTLGVVAAVVGISAAVFAQGARRDGRWEVKMEMSSPDMPMQMPATTQTVCISKEDANDPSKMLPQAQGRGRGGMSDSCKMTDSKMEGNKVTFTMKCDPPQQGTINGEITYSADSYEGLMKMSMMMPARGGQGGGQPMNMTMKYTGKRLGDCTK
jgi:hypothetical protein